MFPANAACNYPGANWKKGVHANWATANGQPVCRDTYISNIPWTNDCAMVRQENATHVTFLGKGTVDYGDPAFRRFRVISLSDNNKLFWIDEGITRAPAGRTCTSTAPTPSASTA